METITSEHPTVSAGAGQAEGVEPVVPRRSPLRAAIKTGRPQEWIKNVFVFAGLLFSGKFNQPHDVLEAILTFVSFCLDLQRRLLRQRPGRRRARPQAPEEALPAAGGGRAVGARGEDDRAAAGRRPPSPSPSPPSTGRSGLMVVGYGVAQMAYSLGLKQIVIVDVMTLAGLFILRVAAGASAVDAHASEWLILCTGMLAALPRLHQAPPGGGLRAARGHQQPARSSSTTRCPSSTRWSPWSPPAP